MSTLKIAIQKKGRLSESSVALLKSCGIQFSTGSGKLIAAASNYPLEILFLRDDDIPQYVEQGVADIGIIGENEAVEQQKDVQTIKRLGFSKCKICLAVPKEIEYSGLSYFNGKRIATSYPVILKEFFDKENISAIIEKISGSVEIAPGIGLSEGVFDIVSSGSTLIMNGLKPVEDVFTSEALMIGSKNLASDKQWILDGLLYRIKAVNNAKRHKYILLNAPNNNLEDIKALLPGMKSPTVLPLAEEGWSSLHSVVKEDDFWEVSQRLTALGAEGILIVPIEKMIV